MKKQFISFAAALLWLLAMTLSVQAQPRDSQAALNKARQFLNAKGISAATLTTVDMQAASSLTGIKAPHRTPSKTDGYYIVNDEQAGQFVIVSADERMQTILGWSDKGAFRADNMPPALVELLESYSREYAYVQEHGGRPAKAPSFTKAPLLQTTWAQMWPYNLQCPVDEQSQTGDKSVTGCVATAMAQVMKFYGYPAQGQGTMTYTPTGFTTAQSIDFGATAFDWNSMLNSYDPGDPQAYTNAQAYSVATLVHACGMSVQMNYSAEESSAYNANIPYALRHFFGYSASTEYVSREYSTDREWETRIQTELEAGRPIIYSGFNNKMKNGHAFVVDGANSDGYHVNWGWSGDYNGYYLMNAMIPYDGGDFCYYQDMVVGIQPAGGEPSKHYYVCEYFRVSIEDEGLAVGGEEGIGTQLWKVACICAEANTYDTECAVNLGVGLYDMNWNLVKTFESDYSFSLKSNSYQNRQYYPWLPADALNAETFYEGAQYYVAPFVEGKDDGVRAFIHSTKGKQDCYLLTVRDGRIYKDRVYTPSEGAAGSGTIDDPYNVIGALDLANSLNDSETSGTVYFRGYVADWQHNYDFYLANEAGGAASMQVYNCKALGNTEWDATFDTDLKNGDEVVICARLNYWRGDISLYDPYLVSVNGSTLPSMGKTKDNPFTVAAVLPKVKALSSSDSFKAYVQGYVSQVTEISTQYNIATFYITDDAEGTGTPLYIYNIKGLNNEQITDANLFKKGDQLVVYGKLVNYRGETPEISTDGYIVSITPSESSGIRTITITDDARQPWYDLQGRRVAQPAKGVYIVNGKKVVIK